MCVAEGTKVSKLVQESSYYFYKTIGINEVECVISFLYHVVPNTIAFSVHPFLICHGDGKYVVEGTISEIVIIYFY